MTVMRCAACGKTLATCQCATGGLVRSGIGRADADIAPTPRASSIEPPALPIDYDPWAEELRQARAALDYAGEEIKPQINNGRLQFIPVNDAKLRKEYPIATGCLDYFPDALAEVAHVSHVATQQHHAGEPVHWDRNKSTDEANTLARHFMQRGQIDTDGVRHSAKVAWRALALLQKEIESDALKGAGASATLAENVETGALVPVSPGSFPKHPLRK